MQSTHCYSCPFVFLPKQGGRDQTPLGWGCCHGLIWHNSQSLRSDVLLTALELEILQVRRWLLLS